MAADAKVRVNRTLSSWENLLNRVQGQVNIVLRNLKGKPDQPGNVGQLTEALETIGTIREETQATRNYLANLQEVFDVMNRDADYKGVVVTSWTKNVFAKDLKRVVLSGRDAWPLPIRTSAPLPGVVGTPGPLSGGTAP